MIKIINGDCLIEYEKIPTNTVDLILTDLPYGNMKNAPSTWDKSKTEWDITIDPIKIFNIANKLLRKNGKMILFSQEPYTTELINNANKDIVFNYRAIWEKDSFANNLGVNKNMVSLFEDILIFSKNFESENNDDNPCREYAVKVFQYINKPIKYLKDFYGNSNLIHYYSSGKQFRLCTEETYNELIKDFNLREMEGFLDFSVLKEMNKEYKNKFKSTFNLWEGGKYKSNILKYKKDRDGFYITQKPVLLLEDLIKTFTNEKDLVVDLTMGSGSTLLACKNTNRNGIGIEISEEYCNIAKGRVKECL